MNKLKTLYRKLVDKIFGKRCECKDVPSTPTRCVRCKDLIKDCACIS